MFSVSVLRLALITALVLSGCGGKESGIPVSGEVTFQGRPLDQGSIEFSPAEGQGTISGAPIMNGRYEIPADHGLQPGKYDVRISSTIAPPVREFAFEEAPPKVAAEAKQRIPAKYNSKTTLQADLKESGENKFDYHIP